MFHFPAPKAIVSNQRGERRVKTLIGTRLTTLRRAAAPWELDRWELSVPPDPPRINRHRRRRRERIGQIAAQILAIVRAPQAPEGDEIVEQDLAGGRVDAEQPCGLIEVQRQARHLAERPEHHRDELRAGRLRAVSAVLASSIEGGDPWSEGHGEPF